MWRITYIYNHSQLSGRRYGINIIDQIIYHYYNNLIYSYKQPSVIIYDQFIYDQSYNCMDNLVCWFVPMIQLIFIIFIIIIITTK